MSSLPLRPAVRGLVMDPNNDVLMVRLVFPHGAFWVLPGGGIDPNEDIIDALHRELAEETGLTNATIGDPVWNRTHEFLMTDTEGFEWGGQTETVFMVRTERFTPEPIFTEEQLRAESLHEHKWWSVQDIVNYSGPDVFAPRDIGRYLAHIVRHGIPQPPFEIFHKD